jgi:hypothetical protein
MKFVNGWKARNKQWDKWELRIRLGAIDVLRFKYDHSDKYFEFRILNLGGKVGGRRRK